jgi:hypothetical protein
MKSQLSSPTTSSETDKANEALLKQFRAYLHLAITAHQTGQDKELEAMSGPNMIAYCRMLVELPDNTLARELAAPITAILQQINEITPPCEGTLRRKDEKSVAMHVWVARVLAQIDLALGFIQRNLNNQLHFRGEVTTDSDFICEALYADTHAGNRAARMIRRFCQSHPEELDDDEGGFIGDFAWDVYQRVTELDRLADEFPKHIRMAARQMHAWPMLMHRHTNNRRRFQELAKRLELGVEYPTDASEGARFRPDTPMVRYLDPLIYRLNVTCQETKDIQFKSVREEQYFLYMTWWTQREDCPNEDVLAVIHAARLLPPLTKATAIEWAEKAIVPLILATDARNYTNCDEPVLQKIAKQKGVKSRATFKSRLLAAVAATLRRLARPA